MYGKQAATLGLRSLVPNTHIPKFMRNVTLYVHIINKIPKSYDSRRLKTVATVNIGGGTK